MSSSWLYTEKVKDHFANPRNILKDENEFDSDGRGEVGNIACGDQMLVVIKVKDNKIDNNTSRNSSKNSNSNNSMNS